MNICNLIPFVFLLAACSRQIESAIVRADAIIPMGASRFEIPRDHAFYAPDLLTPDLLPSYPATAQVVSAVICVELDVSEDGDVTDARPISGFPECPENASPELRPFFEQALNTVKQWLFFPASICKLELTIEEPDPPCMKSPDSTWNVSVNLAFRFEFSRTRSGVAKVESKAL